MKQFQTGAALIVVLFVLIFMVMIGTLAVKQSLVGLNVATNSQAQSLMKQTADAVFFALERDNQDTTTFQKNLSSLGLFGMVKSDEFLNKELVFCFRPKTQDKVFSLQNSSVIYPTNNSGGINNTEFGVSGFCKFTDNDYSSSRNVMISQVAVKKSSLKTDVPFKFYPLGTDASTVQLDQVQPIQIIVTTIIPGAASSGISWSAFDSKIDKCFKEYINVKSEQYPDQKTVAECFSEIGVPYSQQIMDYAVISYASKS